MIKYLCDGCDNEITDATEISTFTMNVRIPAVVTGGRDEIGRRESIFCGACTKKIVSSFENLKDKKTPKEISE